MPGIILRTKAILVIIKKIKQLPLKHLDFSSTMWPISISITFILFQVKNSDKYWNLSYRDNEDYPIDPYQGLILFGLQVT